MNPPLLLLVLLTGLLLPANAAPAAPAPRLNLLLITADDLNADSMGWMGDRHGATPALDAFAAGSHRFVRHHVTAPICQPSRQAIMTGRVPHRSGGLGFTPIHAGTPTLVTLLQRQGYFAGVIDKHPHMKPDSEFPWDVKLSGAGKNPPLMRQHMDQLLQAAAQAGKPFFINANITDPHRPFPPSGDADDEPGRKPAEAASPRKAARNEVAGQNLARVYQPRDVTVPAFLEDLPPVRREIAQYYTAVSRLNLTFSNILAALRASGRADDTIIVFLSDHGMSFPFAKATVYHDGTRSPVLLNYPGMPPAATHPEFVSSVDLLPTLLELLGLTAPGGLDGRSWVPLLRGQAQPGRDHVITHVNTVSSGLALPQRCIRTADHALLFHGWADGTAKFRVEAMSGLTYKTLEAAGEQDPAIARRVRQLRVGEPLMFFGQKDSAGERRNLIQDPAQAAEIRRLGGLLLAHMERTGDPETAAFRKAFAAWQSRTRRD
ncbi:MAG: hypothetical protein RJA22_2119 [Verrucomicrobiota bacterium]|jgi:N-sulfoglucosamine sulfohydrolase